jgi:micrococcal nuclease
MYEYRAKVARVVDGDTVDFYVDLGFKVTVKIRGRLIRVDTPERGHPDWTKATNMCADLLDGLKAQDKNGYVTIKTGKTGKYGRWLVDVVGVNDVLEEIWPYGKK